MFFTALLPYIKTVKSRPVALFDDHRKSRMTQLSNLCHLLNTHVTSAHKGVTVQAGATWGGRIVIMYELQQLLIVFCQALKIVQGLVAKGKDVARVYTDSQAWVLE